ncbi:hypothetical protein NQT62_14630 [Limnobacter humi]|uniref:Pesticin C-terminal domain-containing protein n=1 Tax=Limnobacter humi TaxID=1778671 RepID=A0ABT1WJU7_9BURK|nr:hypothetical protein [Limnobacter humi]MCQ8897674.1 hypothetical protein [Limnobacter humi]
MDVLSPKRGKLTFDSEGNEGGPYHSRSLHHPSFVSGVTLGRGYDMREKSSQMIESDLIRAGLEPVLAKLIAQASGLSGENARQFIKRPEFNNFEISAVVQLKLFEIDYERHRLDAKRIWDSSENQQRYGAGMWDELNPRIQDFIVDLRYQGLYSKSMRDRIQKSAGAGNLQELKSKFSQAITEMGLRMDQRNKRRIEFLSSDGS